MSYKKNEEIKEKSYPSGISYARKSQKREEVSHPYVIFRLCQRRLKTLRKETVGDSKVNSETDQRRQSLSPHSQTHLITERNVLLIPKEVQPGSG